MTIFDVNKNIIDATAYRLGVRPSWLKYVIKFESGGNPKAVNPYTNATGLIQFMPSTASELGTSVDELYNLGFAGQMPYVEKYLKRKKGNKKINSITDLYLLIFYPFASGKKPSYILGSEKSLNYARMLGKQNKIFDANKNGFVSKKELERQFLRTVINKGYKPTLKEKLKLLF